MDAESKLYMGTDPRQEIIEYTRVFRLPAN